MVVKRIYLLNVSVDNFLENKSSSQLLDFHIRVLSFRNHPYKLKIPQSIDHSIEYNVTFSAFEERTINIHYLRDYMRYEPIESCDKTYYSYIYTVGSARAWNHPIELAYFQFWVPKSICDNLKWADYITELGNNISSITSQQDYYVASLQYNDWIPPSDQDFILIDWAKKKPWYSFLISFLFSCNPLLGILIGIFIIFSMLTLLVILISNFKKQRKRGSDT